MPSSLFQQQIFNKLASFVEHPIGDVFILKGYAGTGKTTMIKRLVEYLDENHIPNMVMAPTGRAAKVLRDRVGKGITIHKGIYNFEDLQCIKADSDDVSEKSFHYVFPVYKKVSKDESIEVVIVDESSMISDVESKGEFFTFGTGKLLSDLLTFSKNVGVKKLIFVGDDAQLPPVTDSHSRALDADYFKANGYNVETATLTEVVRQNKDSGILTVASNIRELLRQPVDKRLTFVVDGNESDVKVLKIEDAVSKYLDRFPVPEVGNGVVVCYSNKACYQYNAAIRERLYGERCEIQPGDIILVNINNYHTYGREIFNGDMAKVVFVGGKEVRSNIPVKHNGVKTHVDLAFRDIDIMFPDDIKVVECKIIESYLESKDRDLKSEEQKALYIDFCMRHPKLKEGSGDFKEALRNDLYFNALRVKYGYAITCHKAQGGEWQEVIVDYSGRIGLADAHLKWCYTASTRAQGILYVINPPHITSVSKLKFSPIGKVLKAPADLFDCNLQIETSFHSPGVPVGVKCKCLGIIEALKNTPYSLSSIQSNLYLEKYDFVCNEKEHINLQVFYDGGCAFKRLPVTNDGSDRDNLCRLINEAKVVVERLNYKPSDETLNELFQRILTLCDELGITITNIKEHLDQYYVIYYFKTNATFAYIQFYYKGNEGFSIAMPKSELGEQDEKLKQLISKLQ